MTTITTVASTLLTQNNWTTPAAATYEYLIDDVIDFVNAETGSSIADLSGAAGSKSLVTSTDAEAVTVKFYATLLGRAYHDRGPNVSMLNLSVSAVISDPHYDVYAKLGEKMLNRVRGRTISRT